MDFSSDLKGGGDMVTIPHLAEGPSAVTLTTTTGALTDYVVSETRTVMTINNWKGMSKAFSDFEMARIKDNYNLQAMYLNNDIAYVLAKDLDTALIGQSGQSSNVQLHTGTSVTQLNNTSVLEAIRIAESYSIPLEDCAFWLHPNAFYGELLRKQIFYDASQFGKAVAATQAGDLLPISFIYGRPVYVTPQVGACTGIGGDGYPSTSHRNLLIHKRAIVYALGNIDGMGVGPRLQTSSALAGGNLATRIAGDIMYGTAAPGKSNEGVRIISDT